MANKGSFKLGIWAFIIGFALAIVIAIFGKPDEQWVIIVLAILGIIVGLLNITASEVQKFLVAAIAFLLTFQSLSNVFSELTENWPGVGAFFNLLVVFMAPAAAVVAIKALIALAKD
jgi:hypothetical protein